MADERNQQQESGFLFSLSPALKGGVVAAAGLATLAHQPWGRRVSQALGRVVTTTRRALIDSNGVAGSIDKDIGKYTKSDFKRFYQGVKDAWHETGQGLDKIRLSVVNRGAERQSLASYVNSVVAARRETYALVDAQWRRQRIYGSQYVQSRIQNQRFDRNTRKGLDKFAQDILKNAEKAQANMMLAGRFGFEGEALKTAHEIINYTKQVVEHTKAKQGAFNDSIYRSSMIKGARDILNNKAATIEALERRVGTVNPKEYNMLNYRRLTVGDLLRIHQKDPTRIISESDIVRDEKTRRAAIDEIREMAKFFQKQGDESYERFKNLAVDYDNLFITKEGNTFSQEEGAQLWKGFLGVARQTLPGKLFKVGDIDNNYRIDTVAFMSSNTRDPVFRRMLERKGLTDKEYGFMRIGRDVYSIDPDNSATKLVGQNFKFVSGHYGFHHSNIEAMASESRMKEAENWLARKLDVFQDRETYTGHITQDIINQYNGQASQRTKDFYSLLGRDSEQREAFETAQEELNQYLVNLGQGNQQQLSDTTYEYLSDYLHLSKKVQGLFDQNTYELSGATIQKLIDHSSGETKDIFELLRDYGHNTEQLLQQMDSLSIISNRANILNPKLKSIMDQFERLPDGTMNDIKLMTNQLRLSYTSDITELLHSPMGNDTYYFDNLLRRELAKEAILQTGFDAATHPKDRLDYNAMLNLIDNTDLTIRQTKEAHKLLHSAFYDIEAHMDMPVTDENFGGIIQNRMSDIEGIMTGSGPSHVSEEMLEDFRKTYATILNDEISAFEGTVEVDAVGTGSLNSAIMINRSASPLDIVKAINEDIRAGGSLLFNWNGSKTQEEVMNIWHGLTANRKNMDYYNYWTELPFFMAKRLSNDLNKVGLGFSADSMSSTRDIWTSIITKRVMPIGIGLTYFDWLNDTSRELTGTALDQAFVNGVANVDLAGRRILSGLGADEWLKETKAINPIWQYWGDKDEYQGYEERQEYYRNGYTPVRKAAW